MLISVIITTYNSPEFLNKSLESFLTQKDKNFEIVIADDGSTVSGNSFITSIKTKRKLVSNDVLSKGKWILDNITLVFAPRDLAASSVGH